MGYTLSPMVTREDNDELEQFLSEVIQCLPAAQWQLDDDSIVAEETVRIGRKGFVNALIGLEIVRQRERRAIWHEKYGLKLDDDNSRIHGTLHFRTEDGQMFIHIHFDERPFARSQNEARFGNSVCVELKVSAKSNEVESNLRHFVGAFFQGYSFCYGFGCLSEEFASKNIDSRGGGERVVGLDVSKHLPGIYWANYLGFDLRPKPDASTQLDGFDVSAMKAGTLLISRQSPWQWQEQAYREAGSQAIRILGEKWFYDRNSTSPKEVTECLFRLEPPE